MAALVFSGLGIGLLLAAQVGPVTLLIVRSVLRGGRAVAVGLAMAGAVASIDLLYATLGLAGVGRLFEIDGLRLVLGLVSATILVAIGVRTIQAGLRARAGLESAIEVVQPRRAFGTAVAATALNPLTIALWTISFPAAAPDQHGSAARAAFLLAGVALGTLIWYCGFATAIALLRRWIGDRLLSVVDVVTGSALVGFGGLLGYRSVSQH